MCQCKTPFTGKHTYSRMRRNYNDGHIELKFILTRINDGDTRFADEVRKAMSKAMEVPFELLQTLEENNNDD